MKVLKGWSSCIGLGMLLMAISIVSNSQELYRWTDADGNVHYSDQPPPADAKEFRSLKRPQPSEEEALDSDEPDTSWEQQEEAFQERQAEKAERAAKEQETQAADAERKRNCELAKGNYNTVTTGGRIMRVTANGEREYLSDEEIAKETAEAERTMRQYCDN